MFVLLKNAAESRHKCVFERFRGPFWVPKLAPKARPKIRRKTHAKQNRTIGKTGDAGGGVRRNAGGGGEDPRRGIRSDQG